MYSHSQYLMDAYQKVIERYYLSARQRDLLDTSKHYREILDAAHQNNWADASLLLIEAGIL